PYRSAARTIALASTPSRPLTPAASRTSSSGTSRPRWPSTMVRQAAPQSVASSCWTNGTFWPRRLRASFSSDGNSSAAVGGASAAAGAAPPVGGGAAPGGGARGGPGAQFSLRPGAGWVRRPDGRPGGGEPGGARGGGWNGPAPPVQPPAGGKISPLSINAAPG